MRARRLRPAFDSLDVRLVLDSGTAMISGGSVLPLIGPAQNAVVPPIDWYLPGTPPPTNPDPSLIPVPWDNMVD